MTILLPNLAIAGYRSFGPEPQHFEKFAKVNLFIGRNNAGKSNVIRFIKDIYPHQERRTASKKDGNTSHFPTACQCLIGVVQKLAFDDANQPCIGDDHPLLSGVKNTQYTHLAQTIAGKIFHQRQLIDNTSLLWLFCDERGELVFNAKWPEVFKSISDTEIRQLWTILTGGAGGSRQVNWEPQVFSKLKPTFPKLQIEVIPAIREIGPKGSPFVEFDGKGLIERLVKLQNPDAQDREDRKRYEKINAFVRWVTDDQTAQIEVPHHLETLNVHMGGKFLPIHALGTGIHEVVMLAVAATVLTNHVVCIEEPELHLNPILQKKLMRYLTEHTANQYFISTHSAALMDTPGVEIYHIQLEDGQSKVEHVTSDIKRSMICEDLGYHPSDLLQANCVIWVEGPSDRVYLNWWLQAKDLNLIEGIQYQIMFYGGRLASHFTYDDTPADIEDFIKLRRLNRRGVMILDSDRSAEDESINATKKRLEGEFSKAPGHAWITAGREIENYISTDQIKEALNSVCKTSTPRSNFGIFDNTLKIKTRGGLETQAPKVDIARYITTNHTPAFNVLDLDARIKAILEFIEESNPKIESV